MPSTGWSSSSCDAPFFGMPPVPQWNLIGSPHRAPCVSVTPVSAGDTASNPPSRYAPFNVVASYATQDQAREAAATLQRMGLDSAALEYVSDGSALAASVRAPVKATDEALVRG